MHIQLRNRALEEGALSLVGQRVEVTHAQANGAMSREPLKFSDVLLGLEGRFLRFPTALIALSTVESIDPCPHRQ